VGPSGWTAEAACAGQYELFDTAGTLPVLASVERIRLQAVALLSARSLCRSCPVLGRCEEASVTEELGFWAGMTEGRREERWWVARHHLQITKHDVEEMAG
jgi:hypothetical protein